ncbi:hypothetical protein ACHQM5_030739 [Ranunculus cassubicifolius]
MVAETVAESTAIGVISNVEDEEVSKTMVLVVDDLKVKGDEEKHSCVIDVKCDNKEKCDGIEKVCRICHLSGGDCPAGMTLDLIQLGCGCKNDLGSAHRHCGEAWFKLKGNRCCEICGEPAKNITGLGDNRFMEEWNESSDGSNGNTDLRRGFFRGKSLCNFLMACLVIAFVIPWFFRVNMF